MSKLQKVDFAQNIILNFQEMLDKMMLKPNNIPAFAGAGGSSIGDVYIEIQGNADERVMDIAGNELLKKIKIAMDRQGG